MRLPPLALLLFVACGPVRLGAEPAEAAPDAGVEPPSLDASALQVVVTVSVADAGCSSCVDLLATGARGTPPYEFEWDDGSKDARRHVCAPVSQDAFTVTAHDSVGRSSAPHPLRVTLDGKSCIDASAPLLCLSNASFEGQAAYNSGGVFDAPPWSDCTQPSRFNAPDVVNSSIPQIVVPIPAPTDGETFLGLREGMQASQALCEPIRGSELRSFQLDVRKLDISNVTLDNKENVFLQISGGISANCTVNEVLWVSPKLDTAWTTMCVTIAPRQYMDQLTLLSVTDGTQLAVSDLAVDHIVPVASCP